MPVFQSPNLDLQRKLRQKIIDQAASKAVGLIPSAPGQLDRLERVLRGGLDFLLPSAEPSEAAMNLAVPLAFPKGFRVRGKILPREEIKKPVVIDDVDFDFPSNRAISGTLKGIQDQSYRTAISQPLNLKYHGETYVKRNRDLQEYGELAEKTIRIGKKAPTKEEIRKTILEEGDLFIPVEGARKYVQELEKLKSKLPKFIKVWRGEEIPGAKIKLGDKYENVTLVPRVASRFSHAKGGIGEPAAGRIVRPGLIDKEDIVAVGAPGEFELIVKSKKIKRRESQPSREARTGPRPLDKLLLLSKEEISWTIKDNPIKNYTEGKKILDKSLAKELAPQYNVYQLGDVFPHPTGPKMKDWMLKLSTKIDLLDKQIKFGLHNSIDPEKIAELLIISDRNLARYLLGLSKNNVSGFSNRYKERIINYMRETMDSIKPGDGPNVLGDWPASFEAVSKWPYGP